MRYQGSAAYKLDSSAAWEVPVRRSLTVVEGECLGSRSRRNPAPVSFSLPVVVVAAIVLIAFVGAIRVTVTAATVQCLTDINVAERTVAAERVTRTELQMERSALSSADRIQQIATENYGMVYASEVDTVTLSTDEGEQDFAEDEQIVDDAVADDTAA